MLHIEIIWTKVFGFVITAITESENGRTSTERGPAGPHGGLEIGVLYMFQNLSEHAFMHLACHTRTEKSFPHTDLTKSE